MPSQALTCADYGSRDRADHDASPSLKCAALATGMKCLPQEKLELAKGNILHDWHAEVLAIRAFNRWLVDECADLARKGLGSGKESEWVRWRAVGDQGRSSVSYSATHAYGQAELRSDEQRGDDDGWQGQTFEIRQDVSIHMYCSEAPCGDASMELTMAEQEDATPWTSTPDIVDGMLGRGHFDRLGIVRRKPSRPDAPPTLSKSCSDKLAMKQCTSLLSGVVTLLLHPENAYLSTLVLPEAQYVSVATERAFGAQGRMKEVGSEDVQKVWQLTGYSFKPFVVDTTSREFDFSKGSDRRAVASNLSALWTSSHHEALINGVLQGRRQLDPKGASVCSRSTMLQAVLAVLTDLGAADPKMNPNSYDGLKASRYLAGREGVKKTVRGLALQGWKRNKGDDDWTLNV